MEHEMQRELFTAGEVRLTEINAETDAPLEAGWTRNPAYTRSFYGPPVRPLNRGQVGKHYEAYQDLSNSSPLKYAFAVRLLSDDALVGFVRMPVVFWTHQTAILQFAFGDPEGQRLYGAQTLQLALNYAFNELNVRRVSTSFPACDAERAALLEEAGFVRETARRQAVSADGVLWDSLSYGILLHEWISKREHNRQ